MGVKVFGFVPFGVAARIGDHAHLTAFAPGAFTAAIVADRSASRIEMWSNHNPKAVLARRSAQELSLVETSEGLHFVAQVRGGWADIVSMGADLQQIHGVSPGWRRTTSVSEWRGSTEWVTSCDLRELSLITAGKRPAFDGTDVWVGRNEQEPTSSQAIPSRRKAPRTRRQGVYEYSVIAEPSVFRLFY